MKNHMVMGAQLAPRMVIAPGDDRVAVRLDAERARHAEMHDEHAAVVEVGGQILRPAAEADHLAAGEPLGEARRERRAEIRPPLLDLDDGRTLHHRREAEADGFDFGEFGQESSPSVKRGGRR